MTIIKLTKRLASLSREQLLALLTDLLNDVPDLSDWLEAALPGPAASRTRKAAAPKRKKKIDTEVYRSRVRGIMHSLDHMQMSEAYWHVGGLTEQLRGVEKTAMEFLDAGDADTVWMGWRSPSPRLNVAGMNCRVKRRVGARRKTVMKTGGTDLNLSRES